MAQAFFIPLVPIGVMSLVFAACGIAGVAKAPGCSLGTLLHLALPRFREAGTECESLPLIADLPSVALGFTSTLAMTIYLTLVKRLSQLKADLVESGLVDREELASGELSERLEILERKIHLGRAAKFLLALVSVAGSLGLYLWSYDGGRAFADLAMVSESRPTEFVVQHSWWANYLERPALAAVWIAIGSIGIYFAVKQGYIYHCLVSSSVKSAKFWKFQYVSRARDDDFGWKPVGRVISMVYLGFLNFTISLTAAAYLLRGESGDWKNPVVGVVALVGIWANLGVLFSLLYVMIRSHRKTVARERQEVSEKLKKIEQVQRTDACADLELHGNLQIRGSILYEAPRWYPLRGKMRPIFSLAPILLALYKSATELSQLIF